MKICFVVPSLAGGGAERVAVTVLSALDRDRHERVLYLFSREGVYFDRLDPAVRVVVAASQSRFGRLFELASFIRAERPDIVMPFLSYFVTAAAALLAGGRSRVVFNQQTPTTGFLEDGDFTWRQPWRRRLFAVMTRFWFSRADAVAVTSQGVADDLVTSYGVPRQKIKVLHNPVDLDAIAAAAGQPLDASHLDDERPVIAAAGRLAKVKNFPLLIEAIALMPSPRPSAWILGEGVERPSLEQLARERGLADRIHLLGFQQNLWRYLARADVFVLTSTYEGFGNVLIEAMACGTPVVATRSSGTAEIIEHERNGLLVDSHEPAAVAAAVTRLLNDAALRARLVATARERVVAYAVPSVAERYDKLFRELPA
jgi:glycosyltransferase involved in cell wall biosynthesis